MKIVFTDLDGTLFNSDFKISAENLRSLYRIKENNALNVFVTGRNLFSTQKVLDNDLPVDYLIYSTGIAMIDFKTKKTLFNFEIKNNISHELIKYLEEMNLNFFVHLAAPNNHYSYYKYSIKDTDFEQRLNLYSKFANPLNGDYKHINASQFVIILPNDIQLYEQLKEKIKNKFPFLSYIRATSPLNHSNIWFEIYPPKISKGFAVKLLCKKLNINLNKIAAIGNDYNDYDMLEIAKKAFVVDNSPQMLKDKFTIVASNDENGFSEAIGLIFD